MTINIRWFISYYLHRRVYMYVLHNLRQSAYRGNSNNKKLFLWNVFIRRVQNHNVHILYNYRIVAFANILIQFYHFTKLEGCHCGVYSLKIIMYFDDKNRNHVFLSTKQCNSVVWRSYMCILWQQTYFAFIQLWINNIRMKALVASKIRKCNIVVEL